MDYTMSYISNGSTEALQVYSWTQINFIDMAFDLQIASKYLKTLTPKYLDISSWLFFSCKRLISFDLAFDLQIASHPLLQPFYIVAASLTSFFLSFFHCSCCIAIFKILFPDYNKYHLQIITSN